VIYHLLKASTTSWPNEYKYWIALTAAGWFALNPVNADIVNYVIVSAEMMAALGVIASFACYFALPRLRRYYLYVLPAAVAILAKPTAAIFPLLFLLFRVCFLHKSRRSNGARPFTEVVAAFLSCGAMLFLVQRMTPQSWVAGALHPQDYWMTQPYVSLLYFTRFFWPAGLSADYDVGPFGSAGDPRFWIGLGFVVTAVAGAILAISSEKGRLIGFGVLWFFRPSTVLSLSAGRGNERLSALSRLCRRCHCDRWSRITRTQSL
jgi:hypothetical protein